jgi:putative ABC transport system permease protein
MITGIAARVRSLWRGLTHRSDVEAEVHEEFRFHVDARVEDLIRTGLSRPEATRRANIEFGSFEHYKDEARAARGLRLFDELSFSWLDVRLAFRMLRRYPCLTVVGGLAMAFGIAAAVVGFEIVTQLANPRLPLDRGERIVALQNWHVGESRVESRLLHDFVTWRDELESVVELGAFRSVWRNLVVGERAESVEVAEISASAFPLARVPPLLGRWLGPSDEAAGAPPVMVIGYDVWQTRFDGDARVVGRVVRLGTVPTTVVGVMPQDYAFPVAHSFWVPLSPSTFGSARGEGPSLVVFGRLANGVSNEQAQAELTTIGARAATAFPVSHALLQPRIVPFTRAIFEPDGEFWLGLGLGNVFLLMLIVLASANVALLLFARAVTREAEIAIKGALGANRARLVTQFFAEALVLAVFSAVIGLAVARFGLAWFVAMADVANGAGALPFWASDTLSLTSVGYTSALTLLAALIAGVLPALMVTRSDHRTRLNHLTPGGGGTMRIGGVWTVLIVVQVAVTVLFPAAAFNFYRWTAPAQTTDVGFPAAEYVSARLDLDDGAASPSAPRMDMERSRDELARRLVSEVGVDAAFSTRPPGAQHEQAWFELEGQTPAPQGATRFRASIASVGFDFFAALDVPIVDGRAFLSVEQQSAANVVIVNKAFVEQALGGRNPIGSSIRRGAGRMAEPGPWYEVVGVAVNLGMAGNTGGPGVYFPLDPTLASLYVIAHANGDAASFASRLRNLAVEVEPNLQVTEIMRLDEVQKSYTVDTRYFSRVLAVISAVALLLSLMAIYSVVDFTVTRRTREIGVRVALGASPQSILSAIFRRPLIHVGVGILVGAVLVVATSSGMFGGLPTFGDSVLMAGYVVLMWAVCMLACVVPTRRALRVEPVEALRGD